MASGHRREDIVEAELKVIGTEINLFVQPVLLNNLATSYQVSRILGQQLDQEYGQQLDLTEGPHLAVDGEISEGTKLIGLAEK
jgi:hypothetical protein